jgi:hypothetical protein
MKRFGNLGHQIITTIAYADLFDYPLTGEEIHRYLIGRPASFPAVLRGLSNLSGKKVNLRAFYTLSGRRGILRTRIIRNSYTTEKFTRAVRAARWLRYIPSIELVGVTGALAMNNAGKNDDIDLFIITQPHTLWITRLLVVGMIELVAIRRKPDDTAIANSICLNMFLSSDALSLPKEERDVYLSHEVLQMVPLWDRNDAYCRFLLANSWVKEHLFHLWKYRMEILSNCSKKRHESAIGKVTSMVIQILSYIPNWIAGIIQLRHMAKRRTSEVIRDSILRFHPRDTRGFVYTELEKRLNRLNIPLDNVIKASIK